MNSITNGLGWTSAHTCKDSNLERLERFTCKDSIFIILMSE